MVPSIVQNLLRFLVVFSMTCQFRVNNIISAAAMVIHHQDTSILILPLRTSARKFLNSVNINFFFIRKQNTLFYL